MKKKLTMHAQESASIEERFQQFLSACAARGLSDKTLKTYRTHLQCIAKHLDITIPLSNLTKNDVEAATAVITLPLSGSFCSIAAPPLRNGISEFSNKR